MSNEENEDGSCLLRNHQQVVEYQKVRFVIPWKKDPRTNRPPLKYVEQWRKGSTYFMLHMEVARRHKPCVLNTLVVHKNGWKKIVNIHSELEDVRVLNLYYSISTETQFDLDMYSTSSGDSYETASDVFPDDYVLHPSPGPSP